ncbi:MULTISPECIES: HAD family phosphatase [unclassified Clostridium]|uniref:HAD family hydrolase n=1 Tax=unclassified Clostridium TaxID=2614128 RepID=UPI001C8B432F|nr:MULTISPECIES: HAD family hydrolase [unclassified Clostridium]MBX9138456.1 HAD family hydrolase [Clostridium sp. K12(2020)]MBX9142844.1 HAD family hydrolase [Clostridium sp. K13]
MTFCVQNIDIRPDIYASVLGTGRENVKKVFLNTFGDELPIDDMYIEKDENLTIAIEKGVPLKSGVHEILKYLKDNDFKIALATSAVSERAFKQLRQGNIEKFFNVVVCRDEVRETKPNPEIFLKAAKKLMVEPNECIVIEDSSAGIEAAFNAGMIPIHVVDLKDADENILKNCYKSFNNLNEIRNELVNIE